MAGHLQILRMSAQESGVGHGPVTALVGDKYDGGDAVFLNPAQTLMTEGQDLVQPFHHIQGFRIDGHRLKNGGYVR